MKFDKVQFVYIDIKYLEYLHSIDPKYILTRMSQIIN